MKAKIIPVFLAIILSTSITACSSNKGNTTQTKISNTPSTNKIAATTSTPSTSTVSSTSNSPTSSPATSDSKNSNTSSKPSSDNNNNNNTAETPLKAYKAVLQNKSEFYNTSGKKAVTLSNFLANNGYVECVFKAPHFAVLDMDGDKVPEVVIELSIGTNNYGEFYEVLHYTDGKVYGYLFPIRCLTGIKTDGTFGYSGGARDNGLGKLSFQGSTCVTKPIGYKESKGSNQQYELYFIDNKQVTPDKYHSFEKDEIDKKDATWYVFSENSIDDHFPVNP